MIICMLQEQADIFINLTSFEVDMSHKRIKQSDMGEVNFATYLPRHGKGKQFTGLTKALHKLTQKQLYVSVVCSPLRIPHLGTGAYSTGSLTVSQGSRERV